MLKEVFLNFIVHIASVNGHGYLWDPPGRGSARHRGYAAFPINYDHMSNYCGGYQVQWKLNGGKCGVCGDPYNQLQPRRHEVGGRYGPVNRPVTGTYQSGSVINVGVRITAYHRGLFTFRLCVNNNFVSEVTQDCLNQNLLIVDGTDSPFYYINDAPHKVGIGSGYYTIPLQLPVGVVATQAVLQWNYTTGNSWRRWPNGPGCLGCGPQETFINCADIAIVASEDTTSASMSTSDSKAILQSAAMSSSQSTTMSAIKGSTLTTTTSPSSTFPIFVASATTTTSTSTTLTTRSSATSPTILISASTSRPSISSTTSTNKITSTSPTWPSTSYTTSPAPITSSSSTWLSTSSTTSSTTSASAQATSSITSTSTISTTTATLTMSSTASTSGCTNTCSDIRNACRCTGAGAYAGMTAMEGWCFVNCFYGFCPSSHCQCFCY